MEFPLKKFLVATAIIFIACTLVPVATFQTFNFVFALEPANFWRFTPSSSINSISLCLILANLIANVIFSAFAVFAYYFFQKAIPGSWTKKAIIFGAFVVVLGVYIPVWSMYTIMNLAPSAGIALALDGTFEYLLYTFIVAYILKEKY
jgi:hypothetical protein